MKKILFAALAPLLLLTACGNVGPYADPPTLAAAVLDHWKAYSSTDDQYGIYQSTGSTCVALSARSFDCTIERMDTTENVDVLVTVSEDGQTWQQTN